MGVLTSTAVVPPVVEKYFNRMLLIRARPKIVHGIVAQKKSLRRRAGNTMVFRRVEALAHATTPLVEGTPPGGKALATTEVECTVQQYGDYVTLTDFGQATIEHPILQDANDVLAQQMGETVDILTREVAAAGTKVHYPGAATQRTDIADTSHLLNTTVLDNIIRELRNNNAKHFTRMIDGSNKNASFPVRQAFWGIVSPDAKYTLEKLAGYVPVSQYPRQDRVLSAEIGTYKEIRFLESTLAKSYAGGGGSATGVKATSSNADVHVLLVFGEDAIANVPLEGLSAKNIIKPKGSAGTGDPLDQICTSGWKWTGANVRLNEDFMTRAEFAVEL